MQPLLNSQKLLQASGMEAKPTTSWKYNRQINDHHLADVVNADSIHGTSANAHNIVQDDVVAELQQCMAV